MWIATTVHGGENAVTVHGFENADGVAIVTERDGHRWRHSGQVGHPEQKTADALGLAVEDFSRQVVKHCGVTGDRAVWHR
ncbi:MAG: hypothetical protein IPN78_13815 [Candidatus Accumulibacter sp.]|nr:hypothetical protein [Candidatus Accumulibacter propinquus]